ALHVVLTGVADEGEAISHGRPPVGRFRSLVRPPYRPSPVTGVTCATLAAICRPFSGTIQVPSRADATPAPPAGTSGQHGRAVRPVGRRMGRNAASGAVPPPAASLVHVPDLPAWLRQDSPRGTRVQ